MGSVGHIVLGISTIPPSVKTGGLSRAPWGVIRDGGQGGFVFMTLRRTAAASLGLPAPSSGERGGFGAGDDRPYNGAHGGSGEAGGKKLAEMHIDGLLKIFGVT